MFLLEIDWAIYQRLTGAPLDARGRPVLDSTTRIPVNTSMILSLEKGGGSGPSWGVRIPDLKHPHDLAHGLTTYDPGSLRLFKGYSEDTYRQIPIFDENMESRKWTDVWPRVTFRWNDLEFDPSVYLYSDPIITADLDSEVVNIVNRNGETVQTGRAARFVRPHPDSFKTFYAITASAKSKIEYQLICNQVLYLFPARTSLEVEWASGEKHTCDMFLENVANLDVGGDDVKASFDATEQKFYSRSFTYSIEAYFDNTTNKYGVQAIEHQTKLIYSRILQLQDIHEMMSITEELNRLEVEQIA